MISKDLARQFGKVAVLMGGHSAEREISLRSGKAVLDGLLQQGVDAEALDPKEVGAQLTQELEQYDRVFVVLHGRGGEDGTMQGLLEWMQLPYTGSGVLASALAMSKVHTKHVWKAVNLSTPDYWVVNNEQDLQRDDWLFPLMIKPSHEGSSIGMSRVNTKEELAHGIKVAQQFDEDILVERCVEGGEFTVAILGEEALPAIQLKTPRTFYDYEAKYQSTSTEYLIPSGLNRAREEELKQLALQAFRALGCKGWGRVDVMHDEQHGFQLLEVNTVPGMTDHSLVPMAAKAKGLSFSELVVEILKQTL